MSWAWAKIWCPCHWYCCRYVWIYKSIYNIISIYIYIYVCNCMFPCFLSAAEGKKHTPCIVHLFSIFSWPGSSITWRTTRVFGVPRTTAMHIAAEARSMEVGGVLHWWFNKWFVSAAIIIPLNLGSIYGIKYQPQLVSRISSINSTLYFNKASFKKWCSFSKPARFFVLEGPETIVGERCKQYCQRSPRTDAGALLGVERGSWALRRSIWAMKKKQVV